MLCSIEDFVNNALGGKIDDDSDLKWCTEFAFNNWKFLVRKNNDSHFVFQICKPNSIRDANHYHSDKTWQSLTTTIKISRSKDAQRIATEFKKRFEWSKLAEYKKELLSEDDSYNKYSDDSLSKFNALASILGSGTRKKSPQDFELHFPSGDYYGGVLVQCGSVDFHLRGIRDIELAKRLCTIVREHYDNKTL